MQKSIRAALLGSAVAVLAAGVGFADTTVTVSGNTAAGENQPGWLFNRDVRSDTFFEFNYGAASLGVSSLYVAPITNTNDPAETESGETPARDKFIGELFLGVPTESVSTLSFDFKLAPGVDPAKSNQFYWNLYVNFPVSGATKFYDCRFDYVAAVGSGSTSSFTTLAIAPSTTPTAVATRGGDTPSPAPCPATLAGMPAGSFLRAAVINVGDVTLSDQGVGGWIDNVKVGLGGSVTTYNFEVPLTVKSMCKDGGWQWYGFANQGACVSFLQANDNAGK